MTENKVGRNDPCPCGSGKKYKKCCELKGSGKKLEASRFNVHQSNQAAQGTSRVSSLFFRQAMTPKPAEPKEEEKKTTM